MSLLLLLQGASTGAPPANSFTATWEQDAATWDAAIAETFATSGTWEQAAAAWEATASTPQAITGTATWAQAAATWGANVTGPVLDRKALSGFLERQEHPPRKLKAVFMQPAASWKADMNTNDDELAIAFLLGILDA